MAITYRLVKGSELTHEEMDTNLRTLDFKDYRTTTNPTENDDSSNGFEVDSKWTNTTTGDVFRCSDATVSLAVWDLEVQAVDKVVADTDPTDSDDYDFIGQRWINKTVTGNDEVVNKIFIATAVTSNLFTWVKTYPVVSATGLEAIDDGNGVGWRLIGRDPANYGNIGLDAIDISSSPNSSTTAGATGNNAFCGGQYCTVSGNNAFGFGDGVYATGYASTSIGAYNSASGDYSVALGVYCTASGFASVTIGEFCAASASHSIAIGGYSSATANDSVAIGEGLNAGYANQAVFGKYNDNSPNALFEIGDGVDNSNRSNLISIYSNGGVFIDKLVGATNARPEMEKTSSIPYYDTDLDAPVWWNGTTWKEISGGGTPIMSINAPAVSETLRTDDFIGREWLVHDASGDNLIATYMCIALDTTYSYWIPKTQMLNLITENIPNDFLFGSSSPQQTLNSLVNTIGRVTSNQVIPNYEISSSMITCYRLDSWNGSALTKSLSISSSVVASGDVHIKDNSPLSTAFELNGCVITDTNPVIHNNYRGIAVGETNLILNKHSMQMSLRNNNIAPSSSSANGVNTVGKVACYSVTTGNATPIGENKIYFPKNSVTKMKGSCVAINEVSGEKLSASYDLVIDVTDAGVITIKSSTFTVDFQDVPAWSLYELVTDNGDYPYLTVGINGEAGTDTVRATFSFDFTQVHNSADPDYEYYYYSSSTS